MKTNIFEDIATIIGAIIIIGLLLLVSPFFTFIIGYLSGLFAKIIIGSPLCNAINTLFNTNYFTPDKLPLMGAALGWIGGFFKSASTTKNK